MVVKKSGKKGAAHAAAAEENNRDLAALGGTLEDYFNTKKAYQTDHMRELNKEVTKHLLTGSGDDNAMVMERQQDVVDDSGGIDSTRVEVGADDDKEAKAADKDKAHDDDHQARVESGSESDNDYEDDYESDSSATVAAEKSVAGLTLGEYLHAKGDGVFSLDDKQDPDYDGTKRAPPKPEKMPQKPSATSKKPLPPAVISGMSLDYYLGASAAAANDTDGATGYNHDADSKSPPKRKKPALSTKSKPKSLLAALPMRQPPPHDYTAHEDYATPFQKRMKKQNKLKQQQQQHIQQGGAVAKSILLGDSPSNSQLLMTKHLPASYSSSSVGSQPKDKKKHVGTGSQPPLPKLGASASSHAFLPAAHHRDPHSDADGGDYDTGFTAEDDFADEKLPPLQHQHPGHK